MVLQDGAPRYDHLSLAPSRDPGHRTVQEVVELTAGAIAGSAFGYYVRDLRAAENDPET